MNFDVERMHLQTQPFSVSGFALVPHALPSDECEEFAAWARPPTSGVGTRCLRSQAWCASLALRLRENVEIAKLIPADHVAVQCTYFEKSTDQNWLVPLHQDLSIPVAERVPDQQLRGWSEKEGSTFVQAPLEILEQLVAVRLHLDPCGIADGPLRVVPGSHKLGVLSPEQALRVRDEFSEHSCELQQGGALVMLPMILHASSKAKGASRRRVLHFVFGPRSLGYGLRWQHAV